VNGTEKWYHQQQIRSATNRDLQLEAKWLEPLINTYMRGMPHAFDRYTPDSEKGTSVQITISGPFIQLWILHKEADGWHLYLGKTDNSVAFIEVKADTAWRIFSKWNNSKQLQSRLWIDGDKTYGDAFMGLTAYVK